MPWSVSRWRIGGDRRLTLDDAAAALSVDGQPGLRDLGLTSDARFLYAVNADSGNLLGWTVTTDGALSAIGS